MHLCRSLNCFEAGIKKAHETHQFSVHVELQFEAAHKHNSIEQVWKGLFLLQTEEK